MGVLADDGDFYDITDETWDQYLKDQDVDWDPNKLAQGSPTSSSPSPTMPTSSCAKKPCATAGVRRAPPTPADAEYAALTASSSNARS